MEAGHLRDPANPGEAGEVDEIRLVAQSESAGSGAQSRPGVRRIAFVAGCARDLDFFAGGTVELEFQIRIRDVLLGEGRLFAVSLPLFAEEQPDSGRDFLAAFSAFGGAACGR